MHKQGGKNAIPLSALDQKISERQTSERQTAGPQLISCSSSDGQTLDPRNPDRQTIDRRTLLKSAMTMAASAGLWRAQMRADDHAAAPLPAPKTAAQGHTTDASGVDSWRGRLIGFQLAHEQFVIRDIVELGVAAEQAGFDLLASSDHLQPWQANEGHSGQAWVALSAIGQRTNRIRFGTTVTCPAFRYNPAVVAEAFASLSLLYPGRVFLGVGSGEALNEEAAIGSWPKWPERSERLVEATEIIRKLWRGEQIDHNGKYYRVNARLYDPPEKTIPLMMAGNGPQAMRRVGKYADGLITDPKTWMQHKTEFEKGAREAGKDPTRMPVFIEQYVLVGTKKEGDKAAELWRFGPKAWKPYFNVRDPQAIEERANAEIPLEKVQADWVVGTDPELHVRCLARHFESGATEVHIHSGQPDQKKVIDFYGREVLPRIRKAAA